MNMLVPHQNHTNAVTLSRLKEQEELIREQFGLQKATSTELEYFFSVSERMQLDPFQRQIYGIMRYDGRAKREKLTIQVAIDGMRLNAARTGLYAGNDDAVFEINDGLPVSASVTVYKIVQGVRCPFTAKARWNEYVQVHNKTGAVMGLWGSKPFVMLAKCAEALALRKAFPAELNGVYIPEEMDHGVVDVEPVGLSDEQKKNLMMLADRAGIAAAAMKRRVSNMKASEFDDAVEKLYQRISENEEVAGAETVEAVEDVA